MTPLNSLDYLQKVRMKEELNNSLVTYFILSSEFDGISCSKCNCVQGQSGKGFKKYYCEHITKKIDNKMKKKNKELIFKLITFSLKHLNDSQVL